MRKYLLNLPADGKQVPEDQMIGFRFFLSLRPPKGKRVNWLKSVCAFTGLSSLDWRTCQI